TQQPKLLITGANGFTGQHACKHFSKCGYEITAVSRRESIKTDTMKTEHCDLTNNHEVNQLISKVKPHFLLHLAGKNHVEDSWVNPIQTIETNVLSTLYILEATRQFNPSCKILVIGSSLQTNLGEIANLTHPYSLSKSLQVLIAQAWEKYYQLNIVIAQPTNLIGPGCSNGVNAIFADKIVQMENGKTEKVLFVNNLNYRRDFVDVRDAVVAYENILSKGKSGDVYEILSGENFCLGDLIQIYKNLTYIDFNVVTLTNTADQLLMTPQPTKLLSLGWKPTISITASLQDTLNYHRHKNSSIA
ncbi:MAG: UDP-2-acetamido-2,6-dideoxy-hexulose 4-reductase, partial [Bacillales bacterium]|nr:UDP-2-acetamido-2,6-dideoxy-hexulose 4-reductase [Bacillales bacterium]